MSDPIQIDLIILKVRHTKFTKFLNLQINENDAFDNQLSSHTTPQFPRRDSCQLGVTSSSIDDINNDKFHELHIDEEDLYQSDVLDNVKVA